MTVPARQARDGEDLLHAPGDEQPTPLIIDEAAILDAAASTALMRVGDAFRSMMTFARARYCPAALQRLHRAGLLAWRINGEIAELTHAGERRVDLSRKRARNAARLRELSQALRKETP